jgi:CTP:molybdopterin cytidylyltransferase MocA
MTVYLLAAGRGKRAGGPKAWLERDGRPLLQRQLEFMRTIGTRSVVSIQRGWLERCRALDAAAAFVTVNPDAPVMASLQALLRASPPQGASLIWHVDMPVWEKGLVEALSAAGGTAVPVHEGRRGHPVLIDRETASGILALPPETGRLDEFLRDRAKEVPVPYSCIHENWNDAP